MAEGTWASVARGHRGFVRSLGREGSVTGLLPGESSRCRAWMGASHPQREPGWRCALFLVTGSEGAVLLHCVDAVGSAGRFTRGGPLPTPASHPWPTPPLSPRICPNNFRPPKLCITPQLQPGLSQPLLNNPCRSVTKITPPLLITPFFISNHYLTYNCISVVKRLGKGTISI